MIEGLTDRIKQAGHNLKASLDDKLELIRYACDQQAIELFYTKTMKIDGITRE